MNFQGVELAAITKLAKLMCAADGIVDKKELTVIAIELTRFGVSREEAEDIVKAADALEVEQALPIIKSLDEEGRKYVGAYLATIMTSDGHIDESEVKMWNLVSMLCGLPDMSITEALEFIKEA